MIIRADLQSEQAKVLFAKLLDTGKSLRPLMTSIGEILVQSAQDRLASETEVSGRSFVKRLTWPKVGQLSYTADDRAVTVRDSAPYAALAQFGGKTKPRIIRPRLTRALRFQIGGIFVFAKSIKHPGSLVPARPYLGVSAQDETRILEDAEDYLALLTRSGR
jgi:phage gpG-like protein